MSLSQWKLLNQLRDTTSKLSVDSSFRNVFGKDITQLMKKFISISTKFLNQAPVGDDKNASALADKKTGKVGEEVVMGLGKSTNAKSQGHAKVMQWKNLDICPCSVLAHTDQIISSIKATENDEALYQSVESLIDHIKQHPSGRRGMKKRGVITLLLRIRSKTRNEKVHGPIREALARLGHVDPVRGRGIRILAMDGGGIRGLLILEMLKKLEQLTGKRIDELFDLFCGVSTGSILAFAIGVHHRKLDEIAKGYKAISMDVFKQSTLAGTSSLVWSHAYYDTSLWEKHLKKQMGTATLISTARDPQCPKVCVLSTIVNQSRLAAFVFRNYTLPSRFKSEYIGSCEYEIWQAVRASAAAPLVFEEFKLGNRLHQDGGILINNPTAVGLHQAKLLWPETPVQCVVSFGTGRSVPPPLEGTPLATSWHQKFSKIVDSATDTESVHVMLHDLLPGHVYFRFNPYLTELIEMTEIDPGKLKQLEKDAIMYLRNNEDKFHQVAKTLTAEKSYTQKAKEMINFTKLKYGF